MATSKSTKTKQLEALRQVEVTERRRAREAELAASAAKADADGARSELVEVFAAGADPRAVKSAEKAKAEASDRAEAAGIEFEGAALRAERAARASQAFEASNSRELIAECEPAGIAAAEQLQQAAAHLLAADAAWCSIRQVVGDLLTVTPGASVADDLADGHELSEIARLLRRTSIEVRPPLPHYHGLKYHAAERERVEELRQRREEAS